MKRIYLTAVCVTTLLTLFACAATPRSSNKTRAVVSTPAPQELPAPMLASAAPEAATTQPAAAPVEPAPQPPPVPATPTLPKGHPDISQMMQQQQQQQQQQQPGQLPKGHPDISQMRRPAPAQGPAIATSQPAMIGTLTVRAVQATKDGPKIAAGTPVVVELYQEDKVLDKREGKLDEGGVAKFDAIPVALVVQPLVRVTYNGVDYEAPAGVMDGSHPDQQVQVPVYESTEAEPAWQIRMQHIMVQPTTQGMQVMEMLAVENPTDRAWIGKQPAANDRAVDAKRVTTVFPLPPGATDVQLAGGFHDCCVKTESDRIVNSMPLVPGNSQFRVVYTLPVKDGKAELALTTPAAIGHVMAFIPDDGSTVVAQGLEAGGVANMGNGKTRFYKAKDVAAGATIKLSVSGITATAESVAAAQPGESTPTGNASAAASGQFAKLIAAAGGLVIFVVGGMLLLIKSPRRAKA